MTATAVGTAGCWTAWGGNFLNASVLKSTLTTVDLWTKPQEETYADKTDTIYRNSRVCLFNSLKMWSEIPVCINTTRVIHLQDFFFQSLEGFIFWSGVVWGTTIHSQHMTCSRRQSAVYLAVRQPYGDKLYHNYLCAFQSDQTSLTKALILFYFSGVTGPTLPWSVTLFNFIVLTR